MHPANPFAPWFALCARAEAAGYALSRGSRPGEAWYDLCPLGDRRPERVVRCRDAGEVERFIERGCAMQPLRLLSFFSGVGGLDKGFERAGMTVVGHVEKDAAASAVLAYHYSGVPNYGDVTRDDLINLLPDADVWGGGFPCQDLSVAGNRAGLAGARSGLWFAWHRLLRGRRPRWVVIENVPGLLSSNGGRDFAIVLGGLTGRLPGIPDGGWANAGFARGADGWYSVAWRVLDAQYFGVPQQRRRVFIVACLGDGRCAEVLFECEGGGWHPAPSRETGARTAATLTAGTSAGSGVNPPGRRREDDVNLVAGTLPADYAKQGGNGMGEMRGGLVPVAAIAQSNRGHVTGDIGETLRSDSHEALPMVFGGNDTRGERGRDAALTAHGSGRYDFESESFVVAGAQSASHGGADDNDAQANHIVTVAIRGREGGATAEMGGEWATALRASQGGGDKAHALVGSGVRRLTPRECERLQGFPDDWTAYGVNGPQSDSQRYRQMGNAIAVPVAEWIGQRIVQQEQP